MRSVDVDVMRNTNHFAKLKYKSHSNTHAQAGRQPHVTIDHNNHTSISVVILLSTLTIQVLLLLSRAWAQLCIDKFSNFLMAWPKNDFSGLANLLETFCNRSIFKIQWIWDFMVTNPKCTLSWTRLEAHGMFLVCFVKYFIWSDWSYLYFCYSRARTSYEMS